MKVLAVVSCLLAAAVADHHVPVYHPAPAYKPAPAYVPEPEPYHPAPAPKPYLPAPAPYHPAPAYKEPEYDTPPAYQFGYGVADSYSGANYAHNENRDSYKTAGEYRVALPDGRTQIVTYSVNDAYSGYVADVRYEGEPKYEPYAPAPYKPAPAPYKPAPAPYKPAPAPYKPAPAPYVPAPAPYVPAPAPYRPAPAPYEPAPYEVAPYLA